MECGDAGGHKSQRRVSQVGRHGGVRGAWAERTVELEKLVVGGLGEQLLGVLSGLGECSAHDDGWVLGERVFVCEEEEEKMFGLERKRGEEKDAEELGNESRVGGAGGRGRGSTEAGGQA